MPHSFLNGTFEEVDETGQGPILFLSFLLNQITKKHVTNIVEEESELLSNG